MGGRSAVEDEPLDSSPIFIKECVPSSRWPKTMCRVVENMRDYGVVAARVETLPARGDDSIEPEVAPSYRNASSDRWHAGGRTNSRRITLGYRLTRALEVRKVLRVVELRQVVRTNGIMLHLSRSLQPRDVLLNADLRICLHTLRTRPTADELYRGIWTVDRAQPACELDTESVPRESVRHAGSHESSHQLVQPRP